MNYQKAVTYLESFINYEKMPVWPYKQSLKLERMKGFLRVIGNPQDGLRCIHVAGSKGKGSTCAFIAYILREAGFKTGLYSSPHLLDFRERIRILGPKIENRKSRIDFEGMISQKELLGLVEELKTAIDKYNKNSQYGPLSFFEVYTVLALVYFKEKKTDLVVLETGLGGRLDATNVVNSLISVITPISYEHMDKLGSTLKEIATEKAGIIKAKNKKIPPRRDNHKRFSVVGKMFYTFPYHEKRKMQKPIVISAPQEEEAIKVIRNKCSKTGARLYEVGRDIVYEIDLPRCYVGHPMGRKVLSLPACEKGGTIEGFDVKGLFCEYPDLKINLIGRHQVINAVVAVAVVEALQLYGICVSPKCIKNGLQNTFWPGRCEVVCKNPLIVLDGAQNTASMQALKSALAERFRYKELILVFGVSNDKDIAGICVQLRDFSDEIILTRSNNPRAYNPEKLAGFFAGRHCEVTMSVEEAVKLARKKCVKQGLILVTGSLFVVAQARSYIFSNWIKDSVK